MVMTNIVSLGQVEFSAFCRGSVLVHYANYVKVQCDLFYDDKNDTAYWYVGNIEHAKRIQWVRNMPPDALNMIIHRVTEAVRQMPRSLLGSPDWLVSTYVRRSIVKFCEQRGIPE